MKFLKYILLGAVVTLLATAASSAQGPEQGALSRFVSAGIAYKSGRYEEAIQKYKQIIEQGLESGAVYYNLGNSYYRNGDIGKAVLNYERAKRLIPRDSDLKFNERYALSQVPRYEGQKEEGFLLGRLHSFVDFYTFDEMVLIMAGLIFAAGLTFLFSLYGHWPKAWVRWIMIFFTLIALVYAVGLIDKIVSSKDVAVVLKNAQTYFEPREASTVHFKLSEGMKARILRSEGAWIKIQRLDGKVGWVPSDVLERI
jgi:tetratricopeptide (TPR) repeat protein